MGFDNDIPVVYTGEAHDIFFYDGQRFHQTTPGSREILPKCTLLPLPLGVEGHTCWYFSVMQEDGLRGPIGFCMTGCPGHKTPREACAHYGAYLFEMMTMGTYLPVLQKEGYCAVCKKKTRGYAEIESPYFTHQWFLCDTHRSATCLSSRFYYDISPGNILLFIEPLKRTRSATRKK